MELQNHVRNRYGKCDSPENTVARIQAALSRVGLKLAWTNGAQFSEHLRWARIMCADIHLATNGKGISEAMTAASAYAEFAERLSCPSQWPVTPMSLTFTAPGLAFVHYAWVDGYVSAHQDELHEEHLWVEELLADETYLRPHDLDAVKTCEMMQHWVNGYSLLRERTVKVPLIFAGYIGGSNGIASGNTIEEAILHGACEVFERFAVREIVKGTVLPTIDAETVFDESDAPAAVTGSEAYAEWKAQCREVIRQCVDFFTAHNIEVIFKDLSLGGVLPCVGLLTVNHNLPTNLIEYRILQPGASFCVEEAILRCFTERVQGRVDFGVKVGGEVTDEVLDFDSFLRESICQKDLSFLEQGETVPLKRFQCGELLPEIEAVKSICKEFNTDFIVVDLTHPVVDFPVVRVIMPRLSDTVLFSNAGPPLPDGPQGLARTHADFIKTFGLLPE